MLPVVVDEPFDSPDHIFEVKWGGVRAIAVIERGKVRLHGRNLRDLTPLHPELASLPECIDAKNAVLDGEIIAWGAESLPAFELLRERLLEPEAEVRASKRSPMAYQVVDLLKVDRTWLLRRPLFERRNLLHERLRPNRFVQAADFVRDEGVAFFEAAASYRLEGIIAKEKHSFYLPGERSNEWQEVRCAQSDDFVIGGYTFGGGLRKKDLISSILLGAYDRGQLHFIGEVSIGCTDREARQLLDQLTPLHTERCPFREGPIVQRFLYWCRPELACHVRFSEWGPDGNLRFPVFVAPRPDVPPEECLKAAS
jgi:DNA ligase-1